ncbi:MAG: substrate-binding domain-containing protein [Pseudomonadota bacterium]|nr:substrate-binding domain-containing protein [Pseudomonadota bacterium]
MPNGRFLPATLMAGVAILVLHAGSIRAQGDDYMTMAKAYIAKVTAPGAPWTGPTTGPKAQNRKLIVFVSADQRNGGAQGVGDGAQEAAKVIGWDFRVLDGQGSVQQRTSALNQAIALKPDGIILGTVDAHEQAPVINQAVKQGIKVIGWHAAGAPGPVQDPPVIVNITTDPKEVAKAAGLYAVVDSGGTANAILFTDSIYAIAGVKTNGEAEAIKGCKGCRVLSVQDTPIGDLANRMPQLTTSLLVRNGKKWTYSIAVNDLYFDFSAPSLQSAGVNPATGHPRQISAGDGSVPAFQRIRNKHYQVGTVAEPLHLHGWMCIDELNRAFAGQPPSGFVPPPHLFIASNLDHDGGPNNSYDPENGYKNIYKKIWGRN